MYGQKIDSQPATLEANRNRNEIHLKTIVGIDGYLPPAGYIKAQKNKNQIYIFIKKEKKRKIIAALIMKEITH